MSTTENSLPPDDMPVTPNSEPSQTDSVLKVPPRHQASTGEIAGNPEGSNEAPHSTISPRQARQRLNVPIPYGIFVDLFGIDVYIPLRELSYVRLTDAMGYYEPGDRVLVKVTQLNRDDPDDIRVAASVKQVAANPVDKALEKIEVNSNYAGTVTLTDSTGIFVRLDMGAECRCRFPYRARPPKGARVVVKIAGVDMEQKTVWGNITYVTIPK